MKFAGFGLNSQNIKCNERFINFSFLDLETQNLNVKSILNTEIREKKIAKQCFLESGTFQDEKF